MLDTAIVSGVFSMILGGYMSDSDVYRKAQTKLLDETFLSGEAVEVVLYWIFEASNKTVPQKTVPASAQKPSVTSSSETPEQLLASINNDLQNLLLRLQSHKIERTACVVSQNIFGMPTVFMPGMVCQFTFYGATFNYTVNACVKCDGIDYLICSVPPFGGYCLIKIQGTMIIYEEDEKLRDDVINHAKKEFWIF